MAKHNQKGRSKKQGHFIRVFDVLYDSPAFQDLSPKAVRIYLEIRRRYYGHNNGLISLSLREAAKVVKGSKATAGSALKELVAHGLVAQVNKGHFRNRHATTWRLTSEATETAPPSNEWRHWQLDKT